MHRGAPAREPSQAGSTRRPLTTLGRVVVSACAVLLVIALGVGAWVIVVSRPLTFTSVATGPTGQSWLGFGTNEYPQDRSQSGTDIPWTSSAWALTASRLAFMQPGLTRINVYLGWFNPSGNLTSFNWNTWQMRNLYQVLSWYRDNRLAVQIGMWHDVINGPPESPQVYTSTAWAGAQAALMNQLVKADGYANIYGYSGLNEWDCSYMHPPHGFSFAQWQTATSNLKSAFATVGLDTALIGPDTGCTGTSGPILRAALDDGSTLTAYEDHYYATERQVIAGDVESAYAGAIRQVGGAQQGHKPVYIGEMGVSNPDHGTDPPITSYAYGLDMFDYGVQVVRSGAAGALAWCLDGFDEGKNCGMWNASGHEGGSALRPWFYAWSLLSRFFPPGSTFYAMPEPAQVRIAAARLPGGGASSDWTLAIVNRNLSRAEKITLTVPSLHGGTFEEYLYAASSRTVDGSGFPVPSGHMTAKIGGGGGQQATTVGLTVTIPADSAVLLTTAS
jgi:hypothetical protein